MTLIEIPWALQTDLPLLAILQLLPLAAAGLFLSWPEFRGNAALGIAVAAIELSVAVLMLASLDRDIAAMQFAEWSNASTPLAYHAAADGVTIVFALLAALLTLFVVVYGWLRGPVPISRFLVLVFSVEGLTMAIFATTNLAWFASLVAVVVVLLGYLARTDARPPRKALVPSLVLLGTSPVLILAGALLVGWESSQAPGGSWSFDLFDLAFTAIDPKAQSMAFVALFFGMALLIPMFPLHGWSRALGETASGVPILTMLLGMKIGIYGTLRFIFPLAPEAVLRWDGAIAALALGGTVYSALRAIRETDPGRLLTRAVVTQSSIIVLGLFSLQTSGLRGSVTLSAVFGTALVILLLATDANGPRSRAAIGRTGSRTQLRIAISKASTLLALISVTAIPGIPGLSAAGEIFEAISDRFGLAAALAVLVGNLLVSGRLMWALRSIFLVPNGDRERMPSSAALPGSTWPVAGLAALALFGIGYGADSWLGIVDRSLTELGRSFDGE